MFKFVVLASCLIASASAGQRRRLEEAAAEEEDFSWMSGYTLKYEQCFEDSGNNLVYFSLCPAESKCEQGCEGGTEYVAELYYFVDAFTEAQLGAREYACEMAREECGDGDDDGCYQNYNANDCDNKDDEFNLQEYLECDKFDDDYWIAPTCKEGMVYLGYFTEETCTYEADQGTFASIYGYELDYSYEAGVPVIEAECANCREHGAQQDQNGNDQADEDDVLEQCEELYVAAQDWSSVAEKYNGKVTDVRAQSNFTRKEIGLISAVAVLGALLAGVCCWFACAKKNDKKKALLSEEK